MKKKSYRKRRKGGAKKDAGPLPDQRGMEKMMEDIGRLLGEQEFESIDETNAFLEQLMASGQPIPDAEPRTPLEEAQAVMYDAWDARTLRFQDRKKEAGCVTT